MPNVHVTDRASEALHGRRTMYVLEGANFERVLHSALDPHPLASNRAERHRTHEGDPFSDPNRQLRFTLASDVGSVVSKAEREQLLAISRLPLVSIDALPGVAVEPSSSRGQVSLRHDGEGITVTTTREPNRSCSDFYTDDHPRILGAHLGLENDQAEALAFSIVAHTALGNDYLVSPTLAAERQDSRFWGRAISACTSSEAIAIAGLKARMYRSHVINARGPHWSINTGWLFDVTALHLVPRLQPALSSALAPSATEEEAACADHLLAIRERLRGLLFARDELARLERREALGRDWPRFQERKAPVSGGTGNDLIFRASYHLTAAMNGLTSVLDNLAWIAAARESVTVRPESVGFDGLWNPSRRFPKTRAHDWLAGAWDSFPPLRQALALRSLRNVDDHRAGLEFVWAMGVIPPARVGPELLCVAVPTDDVTFGLPDGRRVDATGPLVHLATIALDDRFLFRPRLLVEIALVAASRVTDGFLAQYPWPRAEWLVGTDAYAEAHPISVQCRGRWHRSLWGYELLPSALRP